MLAIRVQAPTGPETVWTVRIRANAPPGATPLVLKAVYADGRSIEVDQALTVLPAPEGAGFPRPGAVVGALLAFAFACTGLYLARRKA